MAILITAPLEDAHANTISWALSRLGFDSDILDFSMFPRFANVAYSSESDSCTVAWNGNKRSLSSYSSAWLRRTGGPTFGDETHAYDLQFSHKSWVEQNLAICNFLRQSCALVVNDPVSYGPADLKMEQLRTAQRVGFETPRTLISNDRNEICEFIETNNREGSETIAKSFLTMMWRNSDGKSLHFPTSKVTVDFVKSADTTSCPMVYQSFLRKRMEVRVFVCGVNVVAAKIPKLQGDASVDWKLERRLSSLECEVISIPDSILTKIFEFMRALGIVSSSLDFIVNESGEWVFLESNEAGNFLWIEAINPEITLMDMFSKFLASGDPEFVYDWKPTVHLIEFDEEVGNSFLPAKPLPHSNRSSRAVVEA